jgi:hypothetical protein
MASRERGEEREISKHSRMRGKEQLTRWKSQNFIYLQLRVF